MLTITRHELDLQSHSFLTYLFWAAMAFVVGIGSVYYNITNSLANFEYVLGTTSLAFVVLIPILTMKSISEERRQKTDQLLYSLPLSMEEIVIGKYIAHIVLFAVPMLFICIYPLLLAGYGDVYLPTSYGSLFAFFIMGAAFIAVGMFVSSLTENQGIAAGITAVIIAINYYIVDLTESVSSSSVGSFVGVLVLILIVSVIVHIMTKNSIASIAFGAICAVASLIVFIVKDELYVGLLSNLMAKISLFDRFYSFANGDFDMTAIVFYISVAALFIFLTIQSMEKRRYN